MASISRKQEGTPVGLVTELELDELTLTASLAHLQQLHIALRNLRQTLPNVVDSVLLPSSPEQLYSAFSSAAQNAGKEIREFTRMMQDGRTNEALESAKKSREIDGEGIGCWRVEEHANWLDVSGTGNDAANGGRKTGAMEEDVVDGKSEEQVKAVVQEFKESHPEVDLSSDEDLKVMKMQLPSPANMVFRLHARSAETGQLTYTVEGDKRTKLQTAVVDTVNRRPRIDLGHLLQMLASYVDIKTRPCDKCSRLLDRNGQFPVLRIQRDTGRRDGQIATEWQAFHLSCH